jgi:hypothetical protein
LAAFGAALLAGFLAAFLEAFFAGFLAEARFLALFLTVLPAAFFVVLVFFTAGFLLALFFAIFLAAIIISSCKRNLHDVYGHLRQVSTKNLTSVEGAISTSRNSDFYAKNPLKSRPAEIPGV